MKKKKNIIIIFILIIVVLGVMVLAFLDSPLISLFLQGDGSVTDIDGTTVYAKKYLLLLQAELSPVKLPKTDAHLQEAEISLLQG